MKGAYWDTEVIHARQNRWPPPVFTDKHESDANFERVARLVLGNHEYLSLACGSHNIRSIAAVIETAEEMRVPQDRFEFQVLYGMAEPIRKALLTEGLRGEAVLSGRGTRLRYGLFGSAALGKHLERVFPS